MRINWEYILKCSPFCDRTPVLKNVQMHKNEERNNGN